MEKEYHKGQELTMSELGLSLEELAGQPLELFAREGDRLITLCLSSSGMALAGWWPRFPWARAKSP